MIWDGLPPLFRDKHRRQIFYACQGQVVSIFSGFSFSFFFFLFSFLDWFRFHYLLNNQKPFSCFSTKTQYMSSTKPIEQPLEQPIAESTNCQSEVVFQQQKGDLLEEHFGQLRLGHPDGHLTFSMANSYGNKYTLVVPDGGVGLCDCIKSDIVIKDIAMLHRLLVTAHTESNGMVYATGLAGGTRNSKKMLQLDYCIEVPDFQFFAMTVLLPEEASSTEQRMEAMEQKGPQQI